MLIRAKHGFFNFLVHLWLNLGIKLVFLLISYNIHFTLTIVSSLLLIKFIRISSPWLRISHHIKVLVSIGRSGNYFSIRSNHEVFTLWCKNFFHQLHGVYWLIILEEPCPLKFLLVVWEDSIVHHRTRAAIPTFDLGWINLCSSRKCMSFEQHGLLLIST